MFYAPARRAMPHGSYNTLATLLAIILTLATSFSAFAESLQQSNSATASVVIPALNVRSGPGTSYSRIGGVKKGDTLTVVGQSNNCAWIKIKTDKIAEGWVAGTTRYVKLSVKCADIPAVTASSQTSTAAPTAAAPTPTPVPATAPATTNGGVPSWLAPGVDPGMAKELESKLPLDPNKACVLFQNFIGRQILITLTNHSESFNTEVRLEAHSEKGVCIPGGKYTFTISSPGYMDLNYEVHFFAGTRDTFRVSA